MLRHVRLLSFVLASALVGPILWPDVGAPSPRAVRTTQSQVLLSEIDRLRRSTWHMQRVMGHRRFPYGNSARRSDNPNYHRWVRDLWHQRWKGVRRSFASPPQLRGWLCIHRYEARWNDRSPPYYGGLQMDLSFQRRYGAYLLRHRGTADRWTPLEQIWVAERARRSGRGFWPWLNTARLCGLL
jgi:hypothetical protein